MQAALFVLSHNIEKQRDHGTRFPLPFLSLPSSPPPFRFTLSTLFPISLFRSPLFLSLASPVPSPSSIHSLPIFPFPLSFPCPYLPLGYGIRERCKLHRGQCGARPPNALAHFRLKSAHLLSRASQRR